MVGAARVAVVGFLSASYRYLVERARVDLDRISISTGYIRYLDRQGRVIHEQSQPYRFSNWNTVYRSLLRCFGRERYLLGQECIDIIQRGRKAVIRKGDSEQLDFDLIVCADGVNSRGRACLLPEVRPKYAGYVAWRGLVPAKELGETAKPLQDAISYYVYANSHILVYPIPGLDGSVQPGDRLLNFVWYRN